MKIKSDANKASKPVPKIKSVKKKLIQKTPKIKPVEENIEPTIEGFPIVGIGASAGGLAAFEAFFSGMPTDSDPGMAFVLVQHLAPDHKSILTELIRRYTRMQVFEVEDGMVVRPNCAYIIPPNRDMAFLNGALQLLEPSAPRGQRLPIDFFFRSLAQDQHERAICIVLSGTGSDGAMGVRAVKGEGGMAMAQNPESTEYDGMPRSALATGLVDFVLPPAEMPAQLIAYADHAYSNPSRSINVQEPQAEQAMKKIFILLRAQTGHDFSQYKPNTIKRRIDRRMAVLQINSIFDYLKYVQKKPAELDTLFRDLLIGVTNFFRDKEVFKTLEVEVIPKLFANKPTDAVIRIWSPGCSTGEEVYSLAILIQEHLDLLKQNYKIQIFATDIDSQAIAAARAGTYPSSISEDVSAERLNRFFTPEPDGSAYRVNKRIRDMLVFSEQDVIKDPPFSRLDLISCRNLLIYMGGELQKKLMPLFHYALKPEGFLLLGTSETIGDFGDLFAIVDRKAKIYQRKEYIHTVNKRPYGNFKPALSTLDSPLPLVAGKKIAPVKLPVRELTEQTLLRQIAPAAALVNKQGDILYLHGRTGMYLEPTPGEVGVNNILKMAREGLQKELKMALYKAVETREIVRSFGLRVKTNGDYTLANLSVRPVLKSPEETKEELLFLVVIEEPVPSEPGNVKQDSPHSETSTASIDEETNKRIAALHQELWAKEEYLQSANEELETSNEELKSSNEEMQSVNEELQSTNEELETSKEELQSVNEELATVNSELQTKVTDLSRLNNDMNNLLSGTGIGIIFVDLEMRILRFTPTVTRIINLILSDMGRPMGHLVSNLVGYDQLVTDTQSVLDSLVPKEVDVQTKDGKWYTMRIQPYRTIENVIEGAVITFMDISEVMQIRGALSKTQAILKAAMDNSQAGIIIADAPDGLLRYINDSGLKILGGNRRHVVDGVGIQQYVNSWHLSNIDKSPMKEEEVPLTRAIMFGETCSREINIQNKTKFRTILANASPIKDEKGKIIAGMSVYVDISEQKRADEKIKNLLEEKESVLREVHHRIKNNMNTIHSLLALQAITLNDPVVKTALEDASSRVLSMMVLYNKLYQSSFYQEISIKNYLPSLVDEILANFPNKHIVKVEKEIGDFILEVKILQPLGIIINELLTNIMKYAFTGKSEGLIKISAHIKKEHVTIIIQDNGSGIPESVDFENSTGFGLELVNILTQQIKGEIRIERKNGTIIVLEFDRD